MSTLLIWVWFLFKMCRFSGSLYFRCFLDIFVMDIMDFKVISKVKYSVFIHFDFVWFDLTKV